MHLFSKTCDCGSRHIPFRSAADFDSHAVAAVYCPHCHARAPAGALQVAVMAVPGWTGHYSIVLSHDYLIQADAPYKATSRYAHSLFAKGKLSFGFLPRLHADRSFVVLGRKA